MILKNSSEKVPGFGRRLMVVGGFLGAGMTTLIGKMVEKLLGDGVKCGVVSNDQARGLVNTQLMEAIGADAVSEVAGAVFVVGSKNWRRC